MSSLSYAYNKGGLLNDQVKECNKCGAIINLTLCDTSKSVTCDKCQTLLWKNPNNILITKEGSGGVLLPPFGANDINGGRCGQCRAIKGTCRCVNY